MKVLKRTLLIAGLAFFTIGLAAQTADEAGAKYNAGNTAMTNKKYSDAVSLYESALKIARAAGPDAAGLKSNIEKQLVSAYTKDGIVKYKKKNYEGSVASLDKGYELAGEIGDKETQSKLIDYIATIRSAEGMSLIKENKLDDALDEFDKALKAKPEFALSYYGKGLVYKEKGDLDAMMVNMDEAIKLGDKYSSMKKYGDKAKNAASVTLLATATEEINKEHGEEAARLINESFKYEKGTADTYYYLTVAYVKSKQFEEAVTAAKKALELKTGDKSNIYFSLGQALEGKGDVSGACDAYKNVTTGPNVEAAKYQITQKLKCE